MAEEEEQLEAMATVTIVAVQSTGVLSALRGNAADVEVREADHVGVVVDHHQEQL